MLIYFITDLNLSSHKKVKEKASSWHGLEASSSIKELLVSFTQKCGREKVLMVARVP
jgi:hypothetical protein